MLETIITYIAVIAPAAVAVIAEIIALLMVIYRCAKAIKEIHGSNDVKILKEQTQLLLQENRELREYEKQLLEELSHIKNRR
jgi:uncharacterized protein YoxC